jgi:serine/threonine protein kinase
VRLPDTGTRGVVRFTRAADGGAVTLDVPERIAGRYRVDDVLSNAGGQGVIYSARDEALAGRRCLVKALRHSPIALRRAADGSPGEVDAQRRALTRECSFLVTMQRRGECRVPNLLRLERDVFPALLEHTRRAPRELLAEEPYMVMQHVPGPTLKWVIADVAAGRAHGGLASPRWWRTALQLTRELASMLSALHRTEEVEHGGRRVERGFFYGDLKADNCIVTGGEFLTLIDFGGVRSYWRDVEADASAPWASETDPVFTPGYVAPEMADGAFAGELDARVDVYSAGALLWHMLTGQSPTRVTPSPSPILAADDGRLPAGLPDYVRDLLRQSLERDRERRIASAAELKKLTIGALQRLTRGE